MIKKRVVRLISLLLIFVFVLMFTPSVTSGIAGNSSYIQNSNANIIRNALNNHIQFLTQESRQEESLLSILKLPGLLVSQDEYQNNQEQYLNRSKLIFAFGKSNLNNISHYFHGTKYKEQPVFI